MRMFGKPQITDTVPVAAADATHGGGTGGGPAPLAPHLQAGTGSVLSADTQPGAVNYQGPLTTPEGKASSPGLVVGSVVVLKAENSPPLTVIDTHPDHAVCVWFNREGRLESATFPHAALRERVGD